MVDVLSTRLQEVYAKWETRTEVTRNAEPTSTRFSLDGNFLFFHSETILKIHTAGLYCYYRQRANPTFLSQSVSACIKYVSRLQDTTENTRI